VGLVAGAVALALLLTNAPAAWLRVEDPPGAVDAAVVLAGDPDYERTIMASQLVLSGEARLLILTGGEPGPGDSALDLRKKALALGVAPERIRLEGTSRSTYEEIVNVLPILKAEGVRSVALVTSPYHQRRAWLTARKGWPGVAIHNRPARGSSFTASGWWRDPKRRGLVVSEYKKIAYYLLRGWL
jgi:uncharacterized SAM-binding protein YcdF (DUF218 family)